MEFAIMKISDHKHFIEHCERKLLSYNSNSQCVVFLERLFELLRVIQERHQRHCSFVDSKECRFGRSFKVLLFYLKNEIDSHEKDLSPTFFRKSERIQVARHLDQILKSIPAPKTNYIRLKIELDDMNAYHCFMDKKNWKQLFLGKVWLLESNRVITHEQRCVLLEQFDRHFHQ